MYNTSPTSPPHDAQGYASLATIYEIPIVARTAEYGRPSATVGRKYAGRLPYTYSDYRHDDVTRLIISMIYSRTLSLLARHASSGNAQYYFLPQIGFHSHVAPS